MKKIIYIFSLYNLLFVISFAQSQFQYMVSGVEGEAYSIIQTTDGGFAVAGELHGSGTGHGDWYIFKMSAKRTIEWNKSLGSDGTESAYSIIQTSDGGYVIVGNMQGYGAGETDMYILKVNTNGIKQWNKTIGTAGFESFNSVIQTPDNGLIAAGGYQNGILIVKFNMIGEVLWIKKIIDQSYTISANCIINTSDGGIAIAGGISSRNGDAYIIKFNSIGAIQWSWAFGGDSWDYAGSVTQTLDDGLVIGGHMQSNLNDYDIFLIKFDNYGALLWNKILNANSQEYVSSISKTSDGGFIVSKYTFSDMYLIKFNSSSNIQWSRTIGGNDIDFSASVIQTTDGGYAAAGYTQSFGGSRIYVVKLNGDGNTCGNTTTPGNNIMSGGTLLQTNPIIITTNPIITNPIIGDSSKGFINQICYIGIHSISNGVADKYFLFQNYPNPFNPTTKIKFDIPKSGDVKLVIYDILGREVTILVNRQLKPGSYGIDWNGSSMSSGVYFYQLTTAEFTETKRMVLVK